MKDKLNVSLIQLNIRWQDIESNLMSFLRLAKKVPKNTDLIILPETFTTGFTMQTEKFAETMNGRSHQIMTDVAVKNNCAVGGSLIIEEKGKFYNRFLLVDAKGNTQYYDKRHLFTMGMEDRNYSKGTKTLLTSVNSVQVLPLICYDLRFPVWSRNKDNYEVLIYVANWPKVRQYVWDALLKARAIENQCFVIGVNRCGKDGNGIEYTGGSKFVDARGRVIGNLTDGEGILSLSLDIADLHNFRQKFPVLPDADNFKILT